MTGTMVQMGKLFASQEIVLAVIRIRYMRGEIFSSLKVYNEQRNIIHNVSVAKHFIQRVLACEKYGSNKAI